MSVAPVALKARSGTQAAPGSVSRRCGGSQEEIEEEPDGVGDVDPAVTIGVAGGRARWAHAAQEEEVQDGDGVRDVEGAVPVPVARVVRDQTRRRRSLPRCLPGTECDNDFFLAMTYARLGERPVAEMYFRKALESLGQRPPSQTDLTAIHDEAVETLGVPGARPRSY
jgi:hypothetical protein